MFENYFCAHHFPRTQVSLLRVEWFHLKLMKMVYPFNLKNMSKCEKRETCYLPLGREKIRQLMAIGADPERPESNVILACDNASPGFFRRYQERAQSVERRAQ